MKIIELQAENIKNLKAIEIKPQKDLVLITGENGAGKTSVLDCIVYALCGKDYIPPKPVRDGQEKGQITIDLGEYTVTRKFQANGNSTLEIFNKDGFKASSPQALLDKIIGKLSFDPLEFAQMKPKEQREYLLKACNINTDEIQQEIERVYSERTIANRNVESIAAIVRDKEISTPSEPPKPIDISAIMKEMDILNAQKTEWAVLEQTAKNINQEIRSIDLDIENSENEIARLQEALVKEKERLAKLIEAKNDASARLRGEMQKLQNSNISGIETKIASLKSQINEAQNVEIQIKNYESLQERKKELGVAIAKRDELDKQLSDLREKKKRILEGAKLPVEGLKLTDTGITFNNIPLEQVNEAEQIRISMAIAMAMNPTLKVLRIANGSALGSKALKVIENMVVDNQYQAWIEKMDETGQVGIVIEDGEIKKVND